MRVPLAIVACALLIGGVYWLYDSPPSPEAWSVTSPAARASATSGGGTTGGSSFAGAGIVGASPSAPERTLPHGAYPAGTRSAYASRSEDPSDAPSSRISVDRAEQAPVAARAPPPPAAREEPDRKRGKLTLQGSYTYIPKDNAPATARASVTIAATLDCFKGKGTVYYSDPKARIEWQSTAFSFDANDFCAEDGENLDALVDGFSATVTGIYSPLTLDAAAEVMGDGQFTLRFVSTDPAGVRLPHVVMCLTLQDGGYARYALPQNAGNPSTVAACAFLDNFLVKRTI
jgi:hypothetical protein